MSAWIEDDNGKVHCGDCWHGCPRPPHAAGCDREGCQCSCRDETRDAGPGVGGFGPSAAGQAGRAGTNAERARELDDRPAETLAGLARDMAAESRPSVLDLHAERYGDHRTLAAERNRRAA